MPTTLTTMKTPFLSSAEQWTCSAITSAALHTQKTLQRKGAGAAQSVLPCVRLLWCSPGVSGKTGSPLSWTGGGWGGLESVTQQEVLMDGNRQINPSASTSGPRLKLFFRLMKWGRVAESTVTQSPCTWISNFPWKCTNTSSRLPLLPGLVPRILTGNEG